MRHPAFALLPLLFLIVLSILATGCTFPFSGARDVTCKVNILGNSVDWTSKVAGTYSATIPESPLAIDPTRAPSAK